MRLFIRRDDKLYNMYWIKRVPKCIVGFYSKDIFNHVSQVKSDCHFTYPADGDLHYTVRTNKEDLKIYFDRITKYQSSNNEKYEEKRTPENDMWNMLPYYKQAPLSDFEDQPITFSFPTVGVPRNENNYLYSVEGRTEDKIKSLKASDIVIESNEIIGGDLNIFPLLLGNGVSPQSIINTYSTGDYNLIRYKIDKKKYPHILTIATCI